MVGRRSLSHPGFPGSATHCNQKMFFLLREQENAQRLYSFTDLSRSAFAITETEDRLIAAAANMGEISMPMTG